MRSLKQTSHQLEKTHVTAQMRKHKQNENDETYTKQKIQLNICNQQTKHKNNDNGDQIQFNSTQNNKNTNNNLKQNTTNIANNYKMYKNRYKTQQNYMIQASPKQILLNSQTSSILQPVVETTIHKQQNNCQKKILNEKDIKGINLQYDKQYINKRDDQKRQQRKYYSISHYELKVDSENQFKFVRMNTNTNKYNQHNSSYQNIIKSHANKGKLLTFHQLKNRSKSATKLKTSKLIQKSGLQKQYIKLRSIAQNKQHALMDKWLKIDIRQSLSQQKQNKNIQQLVRNKKQQIYQYLCKKLNTKQLQMHHLMQAIQVKQILQQKYIKYGEKYLNNIRLTIDIIQQLFKNRKNKCATNKLRQKALIVIIKQDKNQNKEIVDQMPVKNDNKQNKNKHFKNICKNKLRKCTIPDQQSQSYTAYYQLRQKPIKTQGKLNSIYTQLQLNNYQNYTQQQHKYYLHCRPYLNSYNQYKLIKQCSLNETISKDKQQQQQQQQQQRIHSTSASFYKHRFNRTKNSYNSEANQSMTQTMNSNNFVYSRSIQQQQQFIKQQQQVDQINQQQNILKLNQVNSNLGYVEQQKQNEKQNKEIFNDDSSMNCTVNATSMSLGQDLQKQLKNRKRSQLFKDFQFTGKMWQKMNANKTSSQYAYSLSKTFSNSSFNNSKQITDPQPVKKRRSFLKKRHGRYAAIISKIGIKKTPSMCVIVQNSSSSTINQKNKQTQQMEQNLPEIIPLPTTYSQQSQIQSSNNIKQQRSYQLQLLTQTQQQNLQKFKQKDYLLKKKFKQKINIPRNLLKNRKRQSYSSISSLSSRKKSICQNNNNKFEQIQSLKNPLKQSTNKLSVFSSKKQKNYIAQLTQQQNGQNFLTKSSKNGKWKNIKSKLTRQSEQLRTKQQSLLNQFFAKNGIQNGQDQQLNNQQIQIFRQIFSEQQYKIQRELEKNKKQELKQKLQMLRTQFQNNFNNIIQADGPSVFCRVIQDRRNRIGLDVGLSQYQSIYKLKKPYQLNTHYTSNKNNYFNKFQFLQDSFQIDFIKKLTTQANQLGQKGVDNYNI